MSDELISPRTWSPATSGTKTADCSTAVPGIDDRCRSSQLRAGHVLVDDQRLARAQDVAPKPVCRRDRRRRGDTARPCSYAYGMCTRSGRSVVDADAHVAGAEDLADLVADRVEDALEVELGGQPCWMLLMIASSAARCSVSLSSRCVSSNRRAFSSATLMLAASVSSRRTSASLKACSRSQVLQLRSGRARCAAHAHAARTELRLRRRTRVAEVDCRRSSAMRSAMPVVDDAASGRCASTCGRSPVRRLRFRPRWMRRPRVDTRTG